MSAREQGKAAELLTIQTDLTSDSAVDEITKATRAPFGRIDIPVNNAGIGPGSIRPDSWQRPLKFWRRIANGASRDDRCPRPMQPAARDDDPRRHIDQEQPMPRIPVRDEATDGWSEDRRRRSQYACDESFLGPPGPLEHQKNRREDEWERPRTASAPP